LHPNPSWVDATDGVQHTHRALGLAITGLFHLNLYTLRHLLLKLLVEMLKQFRLIGFDR
jgi:hypothetical protein